MNIGAIADFYIIELALSRGGNFGVRKQKVREKLEDIRDTLYPNLANAIRDYIFLASMGEMEYSYSYAVNFDSSLSLAYIYSINPTQYAPSDENFKLLARVFEEDYWESGYGGEKWAGLCHSARSIYKRTNMTVYIDTMLNAVHNGGSCFDKLEELGVVFDEGKVSNVLEYFDGRANEDIVQDSLRSLPSILTPTPCLSVVRLARVLMDYTSHLEYEPIIRNHSYKSPLGTRTLKLGYTKAETGWSEGEEDE